MARVTKLEGPAAVIEAKRSADRSVVRHASTGDLDALEALENAVFLGDRLTRRSLRHAITAPTTVVLVLEVRGRIAGDAIVAFRRGSSLARLNSIAIDPSEAGQGFGFRLLQHCEAEAMARGGDRLRLEVRVDNAAAIGLYERAGFDRIGRHDDYYEDGAAALRFEKRLAG